MVHLNRGLLHLDSGALDLAEEQSAQAFAWEKRNRTISDGPGSVAAVDRRDAKLEEELRATSPAAQAALDYIRDAIESAQSTQNRRLLARVHTWHGLTLSNEYFNDLEAATHAMNTANSFLDHGYHDTVWEELRTLKGRVWRLSP